MGAVSQSPSPATGVQLPGKAITPAHFQLLRQQQPPPPPPPPPSQVQVPQVQGQAQSPAQIKAVGKLTPVSILQKTARTPSVISCVL